MKIKLAMVCALMAAASFAAQAKGGHGGTHSSTGTSGGSHHVSGYVKKDGTYVAPHQSTNPNNTQRDNWSSKGNTNPYTGKEGTKEPTK